MHIYKPSNRYCVGIGNKLVHLIEHPSLTMRLSLPRQKSLQYGLPLAVRSILRAYMLGYASSTAPRLLTLLLTQLSRRRKNSDDYSRNEFCHAFVAILRGGFHPKRFATFCAALVGGSILLEVCLSQFNNSTSVHSRCARMLLGDAKGDNRETR